MVWDKRITRFAVLACAVLYIHTSNGHQQQNIQEDDFAFDTAEHVESPSPVTEGRLRRLWGVPDTSASVGKLFTFHIPEEAFSGKITGYKVHSASGEPLPPWLLFDGKHGIIKGVPRPIDVGSQALKVTGVGVNLQDRAADVFTVDVRESRKNSYTGAANNEEQCISGDDELVLVILFDTPYNSIKPKHRIRVLTDIAHFMGLNINDFTLLPYKGMDNAKKHFTVLLSGPGDRTHKRSDGSTALFLNVGCGGRLWRRHKLIVHQLREQSRDGTISELLHLPVSGWRVLKESHIRHKRQVSEGSAYDDDDINYDDDFSGYDDDDDDYNAQEDPITEVTGRTLQIIPQSSNETVPRLNEDENEVESRSISFDTNSPVVIVPHIMNVSNTTSSPTTEAATPITIPSTLASLSITPSQNLGVSVTTEDEFPTELIPSHADTTLQTILPSTIPDDVTSKEESITPSEGSSTIFGRTTETIDFSFPVKNAPHINHRMKKVAVTAGKAFSYIIPEDVFEDTEDGTNLHLEMFDIEGTALKSTSWVQFNSTTREVYGLPLEEHVSRWEYLVEATDSDGLKVRDHLDITVQQHKGRRTVNHEFSMKLRLDEKFPVSVDWQILVLRGLVNLFRDTDMDQITVRNVDLNADPVEFIWTNDTLPKNICPQGDIDRLLGILQSDSEGSPSARLVSVMSPAIRVKWVGWRGTGPCQPLPTPPLTPVLPPRFPDNFQPMPRNQIDHINATVGELLLFRVPDDSFYDPEDGSTRNLKMWVVRGDHTVLPSDHWLQFDSKNQEFYGVPTVHDIGRKDYQLICEDSGGLTAMDGLEVVVKPAPALYPSAEFSMNLHQSADSIINNPSTKRKFIEKLALLLEDKDTRSIHIKGISDSPTIITWYNTSLPTDHCPDEEIKYLRSILVSDDDTLTDKVDSVMGPEFHVMSFSLLPRGICLGSKTVVHAPELPPNLGGPNEDASKTVSSDDYLITFIIPAIVIILMILIAGIVACILYRRRRMGKMNMDDDAERQPFRSKGIPVIFQDELDEKPDPSNKSPVIMKEEKPPLLPPPEYKGDAGSPTPGHHNPYHPPPPFTATRDNGRNSRPKATPTYRKPPPYVPP